MATLTQWLKDLKYHQSRLIARIRKIYKGIRIYYMPILPRRWWGHKARKMALLLNFSMITNEAGNIAPLNTRDLYENEEPCICYETGYKDEICPGLLDWDKIHLNYLGYRILTFKAMLGCSLNKYVPAYGPGSGQEKPKEKISRHYKRTQAKKRKQGELE